MQSDTNNSGYQKIFGLYGAGGFAREVMPIVHESLRAADPVTKWQVFFIETHPQLREVNGYPLISEDEFFDVPCQERFFNIAVGDSESRELLATRCVERGAQPLTLRSPHSIAYDSNEIGEGAILCANTMITSNARIGKYFHSNLFSYVAHDCVIGDYVTFAPSVRCNGNVHVHDRAYIGTGAVLKQGSSSKPLVIGEGAIVGMGAVVTKDVAPFTTVVGNPAKPLVKS